MESEANCGIEAHQHDESCYEDKLICGEIESPGHHHSEACYEVSKALVCEEQEHQHDDSCFDESGNLTCDQPEHTHDDTCYKESRELTCDIPESDGHQHSSACYERVLTCGKEIHTHSTACYDHASDSATSAPADFAAVATTELGSFGATVSASTEIETESGESDAASSETSDAWTTEKNVEGEASSSTTTNVSATAATTSGSSSTAAAAANTATASTGNTAFDSAAAEDTYIPQLEPVIFEQLLTKDTDIYYYHAEEGREAPESSADIADWERVNDDTELTPADLLRVYLRYTIPAGTLNATNDIARYRLPSNLHLTDQQMETINTTVNGVANQYVSLDTLEITDTEKYNTYLGIEATEGTRKPSDNVDKYFADHPDLEGQEYINAVVRAENVFDDTTGEYAGQDLVFTFSPYTVQKNQHEYDADGQPTKAGQKVDGWLCFDLHMDQIDWSEPVISTIDNSAESIQDNATPTQDESVETAEGSGSSDTIETIEKPSSETKEETSASSSDSDALNTNTLTEKKESYAEIIFASKDKALKIDRISTELHLVEFNAIEAENDATLDEQDQSADDSTDSNKSEMTNADIADDSTSEGEADKNESADETSTAAGDQPESETEINAKTYPAVSFEDTITVQAGTLTTDNETAAQDIPAETAITVSVIAEEETFPLGTTMHLGTVEDMETVASAVEGAVEGQTRGFHAVDISFRNAEGTEIQPLKPIRVSMKSDEIRKAVEDNSAAPLVVHVEDQAKREKSDSAKGRIGKTGGSDAAERPEDFVATAVETTTEPEGADKADRDKKKEDTLTFEADSFSVYAIVYTVDFHYEVNGKSYDFSIPGGGFVSFEHLVELLGLGVTDTISENGAADTELADESAEKNAKATEDEADSQAPEEDSPMYADAVKLNEVEVSEATKKFVANVRSLQFSSPELVWVEKVNETASVGELKETNGLKIEYSAELTEKQISKINTQTVEAGDWALISMQPFTSEESLQVTMKNGDQFTVKVTDAQISTHVIAADGKDYIITVTYGQEAGIPDGAELEVRELLPGTDEYDDHYSRALEKLRTEAGDESRDGEIAENFAGLGLELVDIENDPVISFVRFFDISIIYQGEEIEPLAPVQVSISYDEAIPRESGEKAEAIHFANAGIESIEVEPGEVNDENEISEFSFKQASFSITGTLLKYTGEISEGKYIIIKGTKENKVEHFYALKSDGSAVEISRNSDGVTYTNVPDDASWTFTKAGSGQYYIENDRDHSWLTLYDGITGNWRQKILVGPSDDKKTAVYFKNPNGAPLRWDGKKRIFVLFNPGDNAESFYIARVNSDIPAGQGYDLKPAATTGLGDLEAWRDKITSRKMITDKTASVADYDNRIYQIDLKATSDVSMLTHKIDLELITDTSRSMYFPATLQSTGYQFHKDRVTGNSSDSLTEVVKRLDKSKIYYFIGNGEQATVYALYFDGYYNGVNYDLNKNDTTNAGRWRFIDSSYMNPPDAGQMNQYDRLNRLVGTNIEDYRAAVNPDEEGGTMCSIYTSPDNITRLAYLKEAVRIASEIVFAADRDSRIGLVTFNKTATIYQDFTAYNSRQQLYSRISNIGLAGGTRQDLGLDKGIELFNNARQDADKIAVLITDGAPNMQYDDTTADSTHPKGTQVDSDTAWGWISDKADALKGYNSSNAKLYTLGLSMKMVGGNNSSHLAGLASGEDGITRHYNAENGNDIANAIKSLIETLIYDVDVEGEVTDALDPAFYPVDQSGNPIEPGTYYDENGKQYTWEKVNINGVEHWRVTYKDQRIGRGTRNSSGNVVTHGWQKTFYAKAKEDFLGGNNIKTNSNGRRYDHVEAKKCVYKDRATNQEKKIDPPANLSWGQFSTPYVNVDELHLTQHSNTWEVYIGSEVNPENELTTLWNNIYVKQVVKDGGLVNGDYSRIQNAGQKYYSKTDTSDTASPTGEPAGNYSAIHISEYVPSINWASWIDYLKTHNSKEETFQYSGYGHDPGTITVKLEKNISAGNNAAETAPGIHVTDAVGKPAETYKITVTYNPQTDTVATVGDTVTRSGEDEVKSENIHIINVVKKAIELTKVDGNGRPITGNGNIAQFTIYRAAKQGETIASDNRLPEGSFTAVKTISTDPLTGKAKWDPVEAINKTDNTGWLENSEYYILETQAPGKFTAYDKVIPVKLAISETMQPVLRSADGVTVLLYDLAQTPTITVTGDNPATYITDITETENVVTFKVRNDITADITIIKTDNASTPKNIGGAVFKLSKDSEIQKNMTIVKASDGTTAVTVDSETGYFTIPEGGVIIKGLNANAANKKYVLTEVTPPDGYVVTIQPVEFTIDATGAVADIPNSLNAGGKVIFVNKEYKIQNEPGAALPNTGGSGTTLIYLFGIMITGLASAAILLRSRKQAGT